MHLLTYRIAKPYEILKISGAGVKENDIKLRKKGWIWPLQKCRALYIGVYTYTIQVKAITSDEQSFVLPIYFTVGPCTRDKPSMNAYAMFVSQIYCNPYEDIKKLLGDVVEAQTRALAASMPYDEIIQSSKDFKKAIDYQAGLQLKRFGLYVFFSYTNNHLICANMDEAKKKVDAERYAKQQAADEAMYAKKKKAEEIKALTEAEGFYVATLLNSFGGNNESFQRYMVKCDKMARS